MQNKNVARLLAAAAIALPVAAPSADLAYASTSSPASIATVAKTCSSGWTHAVIGGAEKCLRRGQFCARRYKRQYPRYGFHCDNHTTYGWRLT